MEWANTIVDALYRQFLLRDFFGKVVPGSLVVAYFVLTFDLQNLSKALPFWLWIVALGLAWLIGMALQISAQTLKVVLDYPKEYSDTDKRYSLLIAFQRVAPEYELKIVERLVVIKEGSGNAAAAIAFVVILSIVKAVMIKFMKYSGVASTTNNLDVLMLLYAIVLL